MGYITKSDGQNINSALWNAEVRDQVVVPFASTAARAAAVAAPVVGMPSYIKSNDANEGLEFYNSAGVYRRPWNQAWGLVSLNSFTVDSTTIEGPGSAACYAGSLWYGVVNRWIRTTFSWNAVYVDTLTHNTPSGLVSISINRHSNGSQVASQVVLTEQATGAQKYTPGGSLSYVESPSVGNQSWDIFLIVNTGLVLATIDAGNGWPAVLVVEDLGPSGAPT